MGAVLKEEAESHCRSVCSSLFQAEPRKLVFIDAITFNYVTKTAIGVHPRGDKGT